MNSEQSEQDNSRSHGETIDCLIDEHKRLKERVRYLEEIELLWWKLVAYHQNKQKEAEDANEPYRHENKRLCETLKFYANKDNYKIKNGYGNFIPYRVIELDGGDKARQVLKGVKEDV